MKDDQRRMGTTESVSAGSVDSWMTDETADLARAVAALRDGDEAMRLLRDLCTIREIQELGQRWHVACLLSDGTAYHEISQRTGASSATISRVNQWLRYGRGGYALLIARQRRQARSRSVKQARP